MTPDDPSPMTRRERSERNRRAWEERAVRPLTPAGVPCPDPLSADAPRALYAAAYRRLWDILHDAGATNQDRIAAFNAARLAARVGQDPEPPASYRVNMADLLGCALTEPEGPPAAPGGSTP